MTVQKCAHCRSVRLITSKDRKFYSCMDCGHMGEWVVVDDRI